MMRRRYDLVAVGVLCLVVFSYFGYAATRAYLLQRRASRVYRPVVAVVVSSAVTERGGPSSTRGTSYLPHIVTRYTVGGEQYQSDRYFHTGQGWSDRASAQLVVDRFPAGSTVEAYVDPNDPRQAVLDNTAPDGRGIAIGGLMLLVPIGAIVVGLRPTRRT